MKTVGIVGGVGPESTIDYYRLIISGFRKAKNDGNYPQIMINSVNLKILLDFVYSDNYSGATQFLVQEIEKLAKAGADFALIGSNTAHMVFDEVREKSPLPLISIIEETCRHTKDLGLSNVGLFGTRFVMGKDFYNKVFTRENIILEIPEGTDKEYVHEKYMTELLYGNILPETKAGLLKIVDKMKKEKGIQALILGGTELPLILKDGDDPDIPFLDTTKIHVDGVMRELFSE